jgi:hypothetical protein
MFNHFHIRIQHQLILSDTDQERASTIHEAE